MCIAQVPDVRRLLPALLFFISACAVEPSVSPLPLHQESRRAILEAALWMPELPYPRKLLSAYGLESQGWELLPLIRDDVAAFRRSDSEHLLAGGSLPIDDLQPIQSLGLPLGQAVFHYFPMRADRWLDWLVQSPEHWDAVGLRTTADGSVHGVVRHIDAYGKPAVAITCALCHSAESKVADFHDGRATRALDLGLARTLWRQASGLSQGPEANWGPGRIDVTDDGIDSPTVIPDLFGLKHAQYLNCSGVIEVSHALVPAIRFETQYILGHELLARPSRHLTVALAEYVMSLESGTHHVEIPSAFWQHCAQCHDPEYSFSGGLIDAQAVGTDTAAATTPNRGTGYYKVPSLLGVSLGGPFFHDGSALTFDDVFVVHTQAQDVNRTAKRQIIEFLLTL